MTEEPTVDNEELRAKAKALKYEVDSLKSEREYTKLQHAEEIRKAIADAEENVRQRQVRST